MDTPLFQQLSASAALATQGYGATIGCFLDDCMSSDKFGSLWSAGLGSGLVCPKFTKAHQRVYVELPWLVVCRSKQAWNTDGEALRGRQIVSGVNSAADGTFVAAKISTTPDSMYTYRVSPSPQTGKSRRGVSALKLGSISNTYIYTHRYIHMYIYIIYYYIYTLLSLLSHT